MSLNKPRHTIHRKLLAWLAVLLTMDATFLAPAVVQSAR
jgi:hypothetical protein